MPPSASFTKIRKSIAKDNVGRAIGMEIEDRRFLLIGLDIIF